LQHLPDNIHLVLVGKRTPYTDRIRTFIRRHDLQQRVVILHGVSDADLSVLYALADTFVYPSRYEGFGIPIIEAINSGLPVVACTGSCLEEAGGPHSLYVSPDDAEALAAALRQTLKGAPGRQQRIDLSRDYVRRFAGNNVAQQVADVYERVVEKFRV
jgi:glycosyltransferase involved in cell wall biosynthesis